MIGALMQQAVLMWRNIAAIEKAPMHHKLGEWLTGEQDVTLLALP